MSVGGEQIMSPAKEQNRQVRTLGLTLALLFPVALVLGEAILRLTHHRPLGAMTASFMVVLVGAGLGVIVRALVAPRVTGDRDSSSQYETEEAPVRSGVMARARSSERELWAIGIAVLAWPLALSWVFFG